MRTASQTLDCTGYRPPESGGNLKGTRYQDGIMEDHLPTEKHAEPVTLLVRVVAGSVGAVSGGVIGLVTLYLLGVQAGFWTLLAVIAGLAFVGGFIAGERFLNALFAAMDLFA